MISAVAFATILAVVAGLTITASASFAHDVYASVIKGHKVTEDEQVRVSRFTAVMLGIFGIGLGILATEQNVAFLVALAFAVAAAANLPTILYSLYWSRFNTRGALWSMYGGLIMHNRADRVLPGRIALEDRDASGRGLRVVPVGQPRHRVDSAGVPARYRRDLKLPYRGDPARNAEMEVRAFTGVGRRKSRLTLRFAFPLLAYVFAAIMLGSTLPTPMYALYSERMHFSVLTTTVVFGVLAALLVFGRWSDAVGRRPMLLLNIAFALGSAIAFLAATGVDDLVLGRLLSGLSAGVATGTATAAVIEAAPEHWRGRAAAIPTVANIGGLGLGPLFAGLLVQYAPEPLKLSFAVGIVLMFLAAASVAVVPETSHAPGRIGFQRLSVPPQVRTVFVTAVIRGFAVLRLFNAVSPSFVAGIIGIDNHAVAGAIVCSIFAASTAAQLVSGRIEANRLVAVGCAVLGFGMLTIAASLHFSGLALLILGAVVAGIGQSISFSRGRRTDTAGSARGSQLHLLRRRVCRDLTAGHRRGPRSRGVGTEDGGNRVRPGGRRVGGGVPRRNSRAGGAPQPPVSSRPWHCYPARARSPRRRRPPATVRSTSSASCRWSRWCSGTPSRRSALSATATLVSVRWGLKDYGLTCVAVLVVALIAARALATDAKVPAATAVSG